VQLSYDDQEPIGGVPPWGRDALLEWLRPVLHGSPGLSYETRLRTVGIKNEFVEIAARRLRIVLARRAGYDELDELLGKMAQDDDLFLQILDLALQHIDLGYRVIEQPKAVARLERILNESGSVWRVNVDRIPTGEEQPGHESFREVRRLYRRAAPEANEAIRALTHSAASAATHLANARLDSRKMAPGQG
jgi:hypothetical protein